MAAGSVDVVAQPAGRSAAVLGFTGHHVVAAGVAPSWVAAHAEPGDVGWPLKAPFLTALAHRLRRGPGTLDVVLVAGALAGPAALDLVPIDLVPAAAHPRLVRARLYRRDVRVYGVDGDPGSVVLVGRGLADRWEVAFEVPPARRGSGLGRALATAARHLIPPGEALWAQVAPGNAASLRAVLAASYVPVGSEVLLLGPGATP